MLTVIRKFVKLAKILFSFNALWVRALGHGVAAGVEHASILRSFRCATVLDVGANRGQFALAVRKWNPSAQVISFEPLAGPATVFRSLFSGDSNVTLHELAIGPKADLVEMHVSARDDSSSLLPISELQDNIFPGTAEVSKICVQVNQLESVVKPESIVAPAMLKLDVQGFEYEALAGCESLLSRFAYVYCECSFVELYSGQRLAADIIGWLSLRGFRLKGIYNPAYDAGGIAVQADFLFQRD